MVRNIMSRQPFFSSQLVWPRLLLSLSFPGLVGACGSTDLAGPRYQVSTVAVTPTSAGVNVGATLQLLGTALDGSGNTISGVVFSWASNNTAVIAVDDSGRVTGLSAGNATVTVSADGQHATSNITVSVPTESDPQPIALPLITDNLWNSVTEEGWRYTETTYTGAPYGAHRIAQDNSAPRSASSVLEAFFPEGFTSGGMEPGLSTYSLGSRPREIYHSFHIKMSDPWTQHSSGAQKLWIYKIEGNDVIMGVGQSAHTGNRVFGIGDWGDWSDSPQDNEVEIRLGQWYHVEVYILLPTTANVTNDGVLTLWVNGTRQLHRTGLSQIHRRNQLSSNNGFSLIGFEPTWGGQGGPTVPQNQYIWLDYTVIRGR